jgi:glycogen debranching enzyme
VPSRRYHGLLVASLKPPVQRVMTLSAVSESLLIDPDTLSERRYDLSVFRFVPGELHPRGDEHLTRFERDVSCRWHWAMDRVTVTKELILVRGAGGGGAGGALIRYTVRGATRPTRLMLRPLVAMRDFHALTLRDTSRDKLMVKHGEKGLVVSSPLAHLHLSVSTGQVSPVEQWWFNFQYDQERDRGYDYLEDLYHPGSFVVDFPAAAASVVTLSAGVNGAIDRDADQVLGEAVERAAGLIEKARAAVGGVGHHNDDFSSLCHAADDFVVARAPLPSSQPAKAPGGGGGGSSKPEEPVTLLAGYPWFVDWGRDAMIALPGLLLVTGRAAEARRLLTTFAAHTMDGLVPNVFDDYTGQPHFNTVDASLWFVNACAEYLRATGDKTVFTRDLLPTCLGIIKAYREGTHFGIKMDASDGLIMAGDHTTQLTWMDAKRDGVVFTPRHGKAVEINALWRNALASVVEAAGPERPALKKDLSDLLERVSASFAKAFMRVDGGLYDTLQRDERGAWAPTPQVRPNQVFAASLRHSPLNTAQRMGVVKVVRERLLTPMGLRTLDPGDPGYKGRFRGRMFERDAAYHNGTVWPWLLGAYAEGVLRAGEFSPESIREAKGAIAPILARLDVDCPGQLAEVFDGDESADDPRRPGGCPAQAWSIAEPLRVLAMIIRAERGGAKGL